MVKINKLRVLVQFDFSGVQILGSRASRPHRAKTRNYRRQKRFAHCGPDARDPGKRAESLFASSWRLFTGDGFGRAPDSKKGHANGPSGLYLI